MSQSTTDAPIPAPGTADTLVAAPEAVPAAPPSAEAGEAAERAAALAALQAEYESGRFSDRELGQRHNLSHTGVQKIAKRLGWVKDETRARLRLADRKVQETVARQAKEAKAIAAEVAGGLPPEQVATVAKVAAGKLSAAAVRNTMADETAAVDLAHRASLREERKLADSLREELAETEELVASVRKERDAKEEEIAAAPRDTAKERKALIGLRRELNALRGQVLALLERRSGILKTLVELGVKLRDQERSVWKLDQAVSSERDGTEFKARLAKARRIIEASPEERRRIIEARVAAVALPAPTADTKPALHAPVGERGREAVTVDVVPPKSTSGSDE